MHRDLALSFALLGALAGNASAQEPLLTSRGLDARAGIKVFNPAGSVRLIAWDKDSIVVRGRVGRGERFYVSGDRRGVKVGIAERADDRVARPSRFVIYLPRGSNVSVKSPAGEIWGTDVSGWFYTVSGRIRLDGAARSVVALAISGDLDLALTAPVVRAESGSGRLTMRGTVEDADLSTVDGPLDVATRGVVSGRFASVDGDITFAGEPPAGGVLDFTDHSGAVTLLLPARAVGVFELSSILGRIENDMSLTRPASDRSGSGSFLRLVLGGGGAGGRVTVRTFKGTIALRPQASP